MQFEGYEDIRNVKDGHDYFFQRRGPVPSEEILKNIVKNKTHGHNWDTFNSMTKRRAPSEIVAFRDLWADAQGTLKSGSDHGPCAR